MQTITEELLKELRNAGDIDGFFKRHEKEFINETPVSLLNYMIQAKNTTVSKVAESSGVGEYVYKIFNNNRKPSRNVLIAIALGMGLAFEEAQLLLRVSKFAVLDSRDKRDSIIIFGFMNHLSVFEIDDILEQHDFITIN